MKVKVIALLFMFLSSSQLMAWDKPEKAFEEVAETHESSVVIGEHVLIGWMHSRMNSSGWTVSQDFETRESCEFAATLMLAEDSSWRYICAPK